MSAALSVLVPDYFFRPAISLAVCEKHCALQRVNREKITVSGFIICSNTVTVAQAEKRLYLLFTTKYLFLTNIFGSALNWEY